MGFSRDLRDFLGCVYEIFPSHSPLGLGNLWQAVFSTSNKKFQNPNDQDEINLSLFVKCADRNKMVMCRSAF